jgi:hypothetical protein
MDNQNKMVLLNKTAWIIIVGFLSYFLYTIIFKDKSKNYNNIKEEKPRLERTGPYLFWHGDSLDAHFVDAGFMQYYTSKTKQYSRNEAQNTLFESGTRDDKHHFSFKLHPIEIPKSEYEMPEKMLVLNSYVSNLEGITKFLIQNNVINKQYEWAFGSGHLVFINGPFGNSEDVFFLWLLYKLEHEALKKGGKVHIVLGQNAFERFNKIQRERNNRSGYLSYKNWYKDTILDKDAELGRWISSKNIIEKIGNYLISESGLNEDVNKTLALDSINNFLREVCIAPKIDEMYGEVVMDSNIQKKILKPHLSNKDYEQFLNNDYQISRLIQGNIAYCKIGASESTKRTNDRTNSDSDKRVNILLESYKANHLIGRFPHFKGDIETTNNHKYIGEIVDFSNRGGSINTNEIRYKGLWIENNSAYIVDDEGKKTLLFKD